MTCQRFLYFILCTLCSVILFAAICKCSSLLREEIFESVQPITTCAANRQNLTCPEDICNEQAASESTDGTIDDCCVCYAKPPWEISGGRTPSLLMIEYIRRDGIATLLENHEDRNEYYQIYHKHGFLSKIPFNICAFSSKLVKIELIYNFIYQIGNISCLLCLDTLDLSHNNIKYVGNITLDGLTNLRVIRITHNDIATLEPSTLVGRSLQIQHADFSHNNMAVVEISNLISENKFCKFDFSSNKITEIINTNKFKIDTTKTYKGGFLELTENNFTKFIDFHKLGITDIHILGKIIYHGFGMEDTKWNCDCFMEPYLELAEDIIKRIWRDFFKLTCWDPPEYRGRLISDMVLKGHLDLFICNITASERCPKDCHCFYQPKKNRTVVNCTAAGLTELPLYLPDSNNITLLLNKNSIKHFDSRVYLKKVSVLDISHNHLETITSEAIISLAKTISFTLQNNNFMTLPRALQTLNPCKVHFGKVTIRCECEQLWIKHWITNRKARQCSNMSVFVCETDDGLIRAEKLSKQTLCESKYDEIYAIIIFSILLILALGISSFMYLLQYEIYLFKRKFLRRKSAGKINPLSEYDAFISFNDDNDILRKWVLNVFITEMENSGYRIFVPCRNLLFGTIKEDELIKEISRSKNFVVILCDYYNIDGTRWTDMEWKFIWHKFKQHKERNIIVINFDQLELKDIIDRKLRAFVRLGYDIDFSNRKRTLIQEVKLRLGSPLQASCSDRSNKPRLKLQYLRKQQYVIDANINENL